MFIGLFLENLFNGNIDLVQIYYIFKFIIYRLLAFSAQLCKHALIYGRLICAIKSKNQEWVIYL
jgi:hypothetical protein